jgi:hypothetical protein
MATLEDNFSETFEGSEFGKSFYLIGMPTLPASFWNKSVVQMLCDLFSIL